MDMIIMPQQKCESPLLELRDINLWFGGLQALKDLNLKVDTTENIHGIIGPNGAGKSTIFNVITGIYQAQTGAVTFSGQDISKKKTVGIVSNGISRTFQNIRLLPQLSVMDNLKMGAVPFSKSTFFPSLLGLKSSRKEQIQIKDHALQILDFLGLSWAANHLPDELPYGDRRKVEIGRSLMQNPRLLLLDEPAAGMNPTEKQELAHLIQKLANVTRKIVVIEHDMKFIMGICNVISVVNQGSVIVEGAPAEIQVDKKVIEVYLGTS